MNISEVAKEIVEDKVWDELHRVEAEAQQLLTPTKTVKEEL